MVELIERGKGGDGRKPEFEMNGRERRKVDSLGRQNEFMNRNVGKSILRE
jgi:hypothetical protein